MADYLLSTRDQAGQVTGAVVGWTRLAYTTRFNQVGSWELTLPASSPAAARLGYQAGLIVEVDGDVELSGPVTRRHIAWGESDPGDGTLVVSGPEDLTALADRRALPVPGGPPYTAAAYDTRTGPAETVVRAYVDANAGPAATAARRIPGLHLAPDLGRGLEVTGRARFDQLLELCGRLAVAGGGLGFRVVQDPAGGLAFQVYEPADHTADVVFSRGLGNLRSFEYEAARPEATYVYAGGGDEATARVIRERGDTAAVALYGRVEAWLDQRDTTNTIELDQELRAELTERAAEVAFAAIPVDTAGMAYRRDWRLGDTVTVEVDGLALADVVREVTVTVDETGAQHIPVVGTAGAGALVDEQGQPVLTPKLVSLIQRLASRTSALERRR